LQHLDEVVVKPAFPLRGIEPIFGAGLAKTEKEKIGEAVAFAPL